MQQWILGVYKGKSVEVYIRIFERHVERMVRNTDWLDCMCGPDDVDDREKPPSPRTRPNR